MISKEYLEKINPNKDTYNAKYSEGTYKFLSKNKNKDVKIYFRKKDKIDGKLLEFNPTNVYSTQIYFMYEVNGDWLGTPWVNIMQNKYQVMDYTNFDRDEFEDITDTFLDTYLKIGRCMFDNKHINFLLGKDHAYVSNEERFTEKDGHKTCLWCGFQFA